MTRSLSSINTLGEDVQAAKGAALMVLHSPTWTCSDGHEHRRPDEFTQNRLVREIQAKHPLRWYSATISLAVRELVDDGTLLRDDRFRLRRAA